ncbi:unnamed protein product [Acanthoscelides obtectus]|uniref:Uncharacterized protein n=1 Tax=Acanthoscelides obtectus TaxID=200917 RepID=A0A9P0PVY0_ACAOB|nr:unnamed protein product [Acanthoscelides obtectus]CAK1681792.1 hypothetical protein AOBTE_LOCUS33276 [Acanthoscelides obtectus]
MPDPLLASSKEVCLATQKVHKRVQQLWSALGVMFGYREKQGIELVHFAFVATHFFGEFPSNLFEFKKSSL